MSMLGQYSSYDGAVITCLSIELRDVRETAKLACSKKDLLFAVVFNKSGSTERKLEIFVRNSDLFKITNFK